MSVLLTARILTLSKKPWHLNLYFVFMQAYIKIYQGEELPHPKSMLQVCYNFKTQVILPSVVHYFESNCVFLFVRRQQKQTT